QGLLTRRSTPRPGGDQRASWTVTRTRAHTSFRPPRPPAPAGHDLRRSPTQVSRGALAFPLRGASLAPLPPGIGRLLVPGHSSSIGHSALTSRAPRPLPSLAEAPFGLSPHPGLVMQSPESPESFTSPDANPEPSEPTESLESAHPTASAAPTESLESAQPAESAEPAESPESTASAAPTEPEAFVGVPAPLREAMRRRGFSDLTAVQRAVLEADLDDRDLRISSQTGSGKTVALGLVLAKAHAAAARARRAPTALVSTPTRELAAQVQKELEWLLENIDDAAVDVVTGGTSVSMERKRLARTPRVVVGTPGRLLDHMKGGALDCGGITQLVLDE